MTRLLPAAALLAVVVAPVAQDQSGTTVHAQAPVVNASVERRPAPASMAREVQAIAARGVPTWIGYRVPMAMRTRAGLTAADTCCGRCRLEAPTELVVLTRVEAGRIAQVRPIAVDCDIDAAGMPLVWFEGVNPDESVRWLESLVTDTSGRREARVVNAALVALSRHAAPSAIPQLIELARTNGDHEVRRRAFLHLGESNDPRALAFLSDILLR